MANRICPKCKSDMDLEPVYKLDRQDGWVWVCPNEDYQEQDNPENWVDPDLEYEESRNYQFTD